MKRRCQHILSAVLFLLAGFCATTAVAGDEKLFVPEMERAVDRAIAAWQKEDVKGLRKALESLTLNETYLLAVGSSTGQRSYLAHVPGDLGGNPNAVAAYLFLIRQNREGNELMPRQLFEGRYFQYRVMTK